MTEHERLQELHLVLEGAVDQLARAHRLSVGEPGRPSAEADRIDQMLADVVALRNEVRDRALNQLGQSAPAAG